MSRLRISLRHVDELHFQESSDCQRFRPRQWIYDDIWVLVNTFEHAGIFFEKYAPPERRIQGRRLLCEVEAGRCVTDSRFATHIKNTTL